jgi:peroxiredoxin Q/BCP
MQQQAPSRLEVWHPTSPCPRRKDKPVSLTDYKGKWVVLHIYPKDQTKDCTLEAHGFQRYIAKCDALNAIVLGVSVDTVEDHKTWCSKDTFSFKLLADPDHKVVDAYGVPLMTYKEIKFANRQTFLISPMARSSGSGPRSMKTFRGTVQRC